MDNDHSVDLEAVAEAIRTHEVLTFRFSTVGKRLLADLRTTALEGPLLRTVDPAGSARERYASLKRLRPRFPNPEQIVSIWWPRSIGAFERNGVWEKLLTRVRESGQDAESADAVFAELLALEREHKRDAIRGEGFETLWSRSPSRR